MGCICRSVPEPFEFSDDAISHLQLPQVASFAVKCVHFCHFYGRSLTRLELRGQHPGLYLAGAFAHAQYGDTGFLKVTAQIIRVAQVLFMTVEESGKIVHSCKRLGDAIHGQQWISVPYMENRITDEKWNLQEGRAPAVLFLPWPVSYIASRIMLVVMRIVEIISHIWQLNLLLLDLYDAIWMNPYTQAQAIEDVFINAQAVADQFVSRERHLARAVDAHRLWIDELLKLVKVDWSAARLVEVLNSFADKAEGVVQACAAPAQAIVQMARGSSMIATELATNYSSNKSGARP
jgi:hypothetical protein